MTRLDVLKLRTAMMDRGVGVNKALQRPDGAEVFCKFCRQVSKIECLDLDREIRLPLRPKPFVHNLTNEEVQCVRNSIERHKLTGLRMRTLIEVLVTTGLRISEALSLKAVEDPSVAERCAVHQRSSPTGVIISSESRKRPRRSL